MLLPLSMLGAALAAPWTVTVESRESGSVTQTYHRVEHGAGLDAQVLGPVGTRWRVWAVAESENTLELGWELVDARASSARVARRLRKLGAHEPHMTRCVLGEENRATCTAVQAWSTSTKRARRGVQVHPDELATLQILVEHPGPPAALGGSRPSR